MLGRTGRMERDEGSVRSSFAPDAERETFERLVQEEMERQLLAVKRKMYDAAKENQLASDNFRRMENSQMYDSQQSRALASKDAPFVREFPNPDSAFEAAQLEMDMYPGKRGERSFHEEEYELPVHRVVAPPPRPPAAQAHFNQFQPSPVISDRWQNTMESKSSAPTRGLGTFQHGSRAQEEADLLRKQEFEKKLRYQRDLDRQVEEKKLHEDRERLQQRQAGAEKKPFEQVLNGRTKSSGMFARTQSVVPLGDAPEDEVARKEIERRKKEAYAKVLEEQVKERERQKILAKLEEEEFERKYGGSNSGLSPANIGHSPASPTGFGARNEPRNSGGHYQGGSLQRGFQEPFEKISQGDTSWLNHDGFDSMDSARNTQGKIDDSFAHSRARFRFDTLDPNEQDIIIRKQKQQQQVQQTLREQIEERKRRAEEEKRREAELEAAEQARIERDLAELKFAYERDSRAKPERGHVSSPGRVSDPLTFHRQPQDQNLVSTENYSPEQRRLPQSPYSAKGRFEDNSQQKYPTVVVRENQQNGDTLRLADEIQTQREQVLRMKQEREALELELARQRKEIQDLVEMQKKLSPPSSRQFPEQTKKVEKKDLLVSPKFLSTHQVRGEEWEHATAKLSPSAFRRPQRKRYTEVALSLEQPDFEKSMPSHSELFKTKNVPRSFLGGDSFLDIPQPRKNQSNSSRAGTVNIRGFKQSQHSVIGEDEDEDEVLRRFVDVADDAGDDYSEESNLKIGLDRHRRNSLDGIDDDDDDIDLDDPSLVERSLPCASRFFVYVSKPAEEVSTSTIQKSSSRRSTPTSVVDSDEDVNVSSGRVPATPEPTRLVQRKILSAHKTPSRQSSTRSFDSEEDDQEALQNDLEQSRARTAQAARMALQRASASSDDDDSVSWDGGDGNRSRQLHTPQSKRSPRVRKSIRSGTPKETVPSPASSSVLSSPSGSLSSASSITSSSSSYSNTSYHVSSFNSKRKPDEKKKNVEGGLRQNEKSIWGGSTPLKDKTAKSAKQKPETQQKWEPFKVYRNVNSEGGALQALETAAARTRSKVAETNADDYSDDFSEDEYIAYGSETEMAKELQLEA